MILVDRLIL